MVMPMQPLPLTSLPSLLLAKANCWLKLAPTLVLTVSPNGQVRLPLSAPQPLKLVTLNL